MRTRTATVVMSALCSVAGIVACTQQPPGATPENGLVVELADGAVQGDLVGGARRFLKIPYAKPPTGERRWKAPEPNDPWTGTRHETDFANSCPQGAGLSAASNNEDCLYLNVWAPSPVPQDAPVMVWLHGGGNIMGSAADNVPLTQQRWFDGQFFAARQGVVLVSLNYRVGVMGFLAHPDLPGEGSPLGNQGLLDQRRALEWVRDNISRFGGDPAKVTIFGESAGSADVCYHIASPGSRGLFHRGISQSGGCTLLDGLQSTIEEATPLVEAFAQRLGCAGVADALGCLRAKPTADIVTAAQQQPAGDLTDLGPPSPGFGAVVDGPGGFLPDVPTNLFDRGEVANVPYILGTNNDEGALLNMVNTVPTEARYLELLANRFPDIADELAAQYPVSAYADPKAAFDAVISDWFMICGTHDTGRRAAKAGLPVYMYNFNVPWNLINGITPGLLKASHAAEISHVFGAPRNADPQSQAVSEAMQRYWATFAATGDPNHAGAPAEWPAFAPTPDDRDQRLQFDTPTRVVQDFKRDECRFWRDLVAP